MPSVVHATHALGRPRDDVRYTGCYLLLAARAPERPGRAGAGDPTDEPLAIAVGLSALTPADGPTKVERRVLRTSAVGSGHASRVGAEAAPHLATEVAGSDEVLEQRRGRKTALTELEIELALDGE